MKELNLSELKMFLDEKESLYNQAQFTEADPIQVPHGFQLKQDIEISGFLTATIAWGNRKSIINDAQKMMDWMGNAPHDFVINHKPSDLKSFRDKTVHRTFNGEDFSFFMNKLQNLYQEHESLESLFQLKEEEFNFYHAIERFRFAFFDGETDHRSRKHVSSPYKNAAAKRIIMFLRWMVRQDKKGVDFGIWKSIDMKYLSIPLDVHTGNISRKLGLVTRKQNDWKTVEELDSSLRKMDDKDPAKYDFALFGLGVDQDF